MFRLISSATRGFLLLVLATATLLALAGQIAGAVNPRYDADESRLMDFVQLCLLTFTTMGAFRMAHEPRSDFPMTRDIALAVAGVFALVLSSEIVWGSHLFAEAGGLAAAPSWDWARAFRLAVVGAAPVVISVLPVCTSSAGRPRWRPAWTVTDVRGGPWMMAVATMVVAGVEVTGWRLPLFHFTESDEMTLYAAAMLCVAVLSPWGAAAKPMVPTAADAAARRLRPGLASV